MARSIDDCGVTLAAVSACTSATNWHSTSIDADIMKNALGVFLEQPIAQSAIMLSSYLTERVYKYYGRPRNSRDPRRLQTMPWMVFDFGKSPQRI
jgi:hypothetical protein